MPQFPNQNYSLPPLITARPRPSNSTHQHCSLRLRLAAIRLNTTHLHTVCSSMPCVLTSYPYRATPRPYNKMPCRYLLHIAISINHNTSLSMRKYHHLLTVHPLQDHHFRLLPKQLCCSLHYSLHQHDSSLTAPRELNRQSICKFDSA